MDMSLVAAVTAMNQASVQSGVQLSVLKESISTSQNNALKLLQTMPSVDVNPNIGSKLNVVA